MTISDDWNYAKVRLRKYWFNRNYMNVHYGGSLFSMTDGFYMLMIMQKMGKRYIVWDKRASIKFIKPGRKDVFAKFQLSDKEIEDFTQQLVDIPKLEIEKVVQVIDSDGLLISEVTKIVHISKKTGPAKISG